MKNILPILPNTNKTNLGNLIYCSYLSYLSYLYLLFITISGKLVKLKIKASYPSQIFDIKLIKRV
jgi:hypothetical protein